MKFFIDRLMTDDFLYKFCFGIFVYFTFTCIFYSILTIKSALVWYLRVLWMHNWLYMKRGTRALLVCAHSPPVITSLKTESCLKVLFFNNFFIHGLNFKNLSISEKLLIIIYYKQYWNLHFYLLQRLLTTFIHV